ncbi:MAG: GAF domain-containing protein [Candidatus Schekmanbacteria bacterium]|nr:GAF domain-containing protein [Candidatus Schekmanbacteria bacterium]
MEKLIHCRKCGKLMKREIVDGWKAKLVCSCGFSDFELISGVTRSLAPKLIKAKRRELTDVSKDIELEFEYSKSEREKNELACISEVTFLLAGGGKKEELNKTIMTRVCKVLNATTASLYIAENDSLLLTVGIGIKDDLVGKIKLKIGEGITGLAAENRELIIVEDISLDDRSKRIDGIDEGNLKAMIAMPVLAGNEVVGVMNIKSSRKRVFVEDEIFFISTMANILSLNINRLGN